MSSSPACAALAKVCTLLRTLQRAELGLHLGQLRDHVLQPRLRGGRARAPLARRRGGARQRGAPRRPQRRQQLRDLPPRAQLRCWEAGKSRNFACSSGSGRENQYWATCMANQQTNQFAQISWAPSRLFFIMRQHMLTFAGHRRKPVLCCTCLVAQRGVVAAVSGARQGLPQQAPHVRSGTGGGGGVGGSGCHSSALHGTVHAVRQL